MRAIRGTVLMGAVVLATGLVAAPAEASGGWRVLDRNTHVGDDSLVTVTATGARAAWAGGYVANDDGSVSPRLRAYDGRRWRNMAAPPGFTEVFDLDATSPGNLWAFNGDDRIARWNGRRWLSAPLPAAGYVHAEAAVRGPGDVWAFGRFFGDEGDIPAAYRYDGTAWRETAAPGFVRASDATPGGELWAAGETTARRQTAFRLAGGGWQAMPLPEAPSADGMTFVRDIVAVAADDVWVVGEVFDIDRGGVPYAAHWDGTTWTRRDHEIPAEPRLFTLLSAAYDGSSLWALDGSGRIVRYLGGRWTVTTPAYLGTSGDDLFEELTAVPGSRRTLGAGGLAEGPGNSARDGAIVGRG